MKIKLIKKNEEGKSYQADNFKIYYRYRGSVAGDNSENYAEIIYLINGKAEITFKDLSWVVEAPAKIEFPAKTYHKIKALSDIAFIVFKII